MIKKLGVLIVLVVLAIGVFFMTQSKEQNAGTKTAQNNSSQDSSDYNSDQTKPSSTYSPLSEQEEDEYEDIFDEEIRPATELYSNATDAFNAVVKAATDYDDIVLEQFAELDDSCSWCPEFYKSISEELLSASSSQNDKSYYAELLAITGKTDNVKTLVDAYKGSENKDDQELYIEALELSAGSDDLVEYFGEQLDTEDQVLKESVIAGITNHGSKKSVEMLYNETLKSGDSDGFYNLGIGVGEIIPEKEAFPFLIEKAKTADQYSHLAVKALLNDGDEGLKEVFSILESNNDSNTNQKLLVDAIDHVSFDEETESYIDGIISNSSNSDVVKFAKEIKDEMAYEFEEDEDEDF